MRKKPQPAKKKAKKKRKIKMEFLCTQKSSRTLPFMCSEEVAKDQIMHVHKDHPVWEITFTYNPPRELDKIPDMVYCTVNFATASKEIADKYEVGSIYNGLPT